MNIKPIIFAIAAAAASMPTVAQINSPQSTGYVARAAAMLGDGNFQGCIDQCNVALSLGNQDREQLSWLRAVAAFKGGLPEAGEALTNFINRYPASARIQTARFYSATLTFYNGDYISAINRLQAINPNALSDNDREDLEYRIAYCQIKLGEYDAAEKTMTELAKIDRYTDAATFYLGYIAFAKGDYDSALTKFKSCNKSVAPGNMADYYVGQILFKQGKYGDALNVLMPLLARKDVDAEFHEEAERIAGECFHAIGDDNRAMVYLNPYIERHPDDAPLSTRYIVGVERYQMGGYEDALRLLAPVTETNDIMAQSASLTMGQAYLATGNNKAALMAFDKAVQLDFDKQLTEMAYYNYAVAQVNGGRIPFGSSVQTLEDFIARYPNSRRVSSVRDYLVKGYIATDDYAGALRSLNSIKGTPTESELNALQQVNFVLGTRALQSGNTSEAVAYLLESRKYAKQNADVARQTTLWLGDAYYALQDYDKAKTEYQAFLKAASTNDENRAVAQYNLGYALFGLRDYDAAREQFLAVKDSKKLSADVRVDCLNRIGDTYYYVKQFDNAKTYYSRAFAANPSSGDYPLLQQAMMEGHLGQPSAKIATLDKLIGEFTTSPLRPRAITEKALTQVAQGKSKDAINTYLTLSETYPSTAQGRNALLQLGIIYNNIGNVEKSKEYYKAVITRHPSSSEAAVAVQDLKRIYGEEGKIEELQALLQATEGAPQLDAVEVNAIASSSLLNTAKSATTAAARLSAAETLLEKYPDSEGAEEAMMIAADAEYELGIADKALTRYSELEKRASSVSIQHQARMGILRSARDMGENDLIISVSDQIMQSSVSSASDLSEVKFIRACAFASNGKTSSAIALWKELSATPSNIYGTRASFELADYYFRSGELTLASSTAEALIDANPPHAYWLARTFILYSDILRAQGSDFEADEYLRALRSNYPGAETDIFMMIDQRLSQQ